jgi:hypothetical protein
MMVHAEVLWDGVKLEDADSLEDGVILEDGDEEELTEMEDENL